MSTKTVTLSQDAYDQLAGLKEGHESFSDVVRRLASRQSLRRFAGVLSNKEASDIEDTIKKGRAMSKERTKRLLKELR